MTIATELRAMLREEAAEPLSYPRLGGVSEEYLAEYNKGYALACRVVANDAWIFDEEIWLEVTVKVVAIFGATEAADPFTAGLVDALAWIRTELVGIEVPK